MQVRAAGAGGEAPGGDRPPASLAPPITACPEPVPRLIQLGEVAGRLIKQGGQLGPLERDGARPRDRARRRWRPQRTTPRSRRTPAECGHPGQGVLPFGVQRTPDCRRRPGGSAPSAGHAGPPPGRLARAALHPAALHPAGLCSPGLCLQIVGRRLRGARRRARAVEEELSTARCRGLLLARTTCWMCRTAAVTTAPRRWMSSPWAPCPFEQRERRPARDGKGR